MQKEKKVTLITGGSAGIGLALARQFLKQDHQVLITGRNEARLQQAQKSLPELTTIRSDITSEQDRNDLVQQLKQKNITIDLLINNAGTGGGCLFNDAEAIQLIQTQIQTNLLAPIQLTHTLLPLMQRPSMIINITSGYALWPCVASPGYSAAKAGFSAFTHVLREQLREKQIHVMEVCPPMVETDMVADVNCRKVSADKVAREVIKGIDRKKSRVLIGSCKTLEPMRRFLPRLTKLVISRWPVSLADLKNKSERTHE